MALRIQTILFLSATIPVAAMGWGGINALIKSHKNWAPNLISCTPFVMGAGCLLSSLLILRTTGRWRSYRFLNTLDHELTHILFGYLTLSGVSNLSVSGLGSGRVTMDRTNFVVALAPYLVTFPLLTTVLIHLVSSNSIEFWTRLLLGVGVSYHVFSVVSHAKPSQDDFKQTTYPLGLLWILSGLICVFGVVIELVLDQNDGAMEFLSEAWSIGFSIFTLVF